MTYFLQNLVKQKKQRAYWTLPSLSKIYSNVSFVKFLEDFLFKSKEKTAFTFQTESLSKNPRYSSIY